ncbi:hypothetical protein CDLVIII_5412 [Clostridium sp. DL-VIII]|uniref:hypothetical protein n=1 Tax=Clostridium sp. DL-VIII TaxID=641107 RepID=UPI00023B0423|nr:hypothetical protein [Clostridium sp. DL-VIII]EHJ01894.1 hypothetical protein CDLVIII_5412 [Clostridium sp. DL-VIII]
MNNILMYISKEDYQKACGSLKSGQTINIYKGNNVEIDIKKVGRKIYNFISHYGDNDAKECLEDMYLRKSNLLAL